VRARLARLVAHLRAHPSHAVLGALLLLWLVLYFSHPHEPRDAAAGKGKYEPVIARGDGHYIYMNTLSIVFDRDISLENQYKRFGDPFNNGPTKIGPSGYSWIYPIGTAILQAPFFVIAHASSKVLNLFGADIPSHGYTRWHMRVTFLGTLLAGFGAIVFAWRTARRHVSGVAATYGAVIVALGTAVLFYGVYWVGYNHAWTAFGVAWLLCYWDATRGRTDPKRWAALGGLVGLAALTRLQEVTWAAIPAVEWGVLAVAAARKRDRRVVGQLAIGGALATVCALAVAAPQLYANWKVFGGALEVGQPNYMRWEAPFLWEPLFSTRNGLFVWTPLAYAGVLGLFAAMKPSRALAGALALGFALQVYVNGSAWSWWFDWSFSARRFVDCTAPFVVGIAFLIERGRRLAQRYPRLAPHAALVLAVLPLVAMNLELTRAVSKGKQRVGQPVEAAKLYAGSLSRFLTSIEGSVGMPTSWPANWLWAIRHDTSPGNYEEVVGHERLIISNHDYRKPKTRTVEKVELGQKPVLDELGAGGWTGPEKVDGRDAAWAKDGARLLLPLFLDEDVELVLVARAAEGAAPALLVNGDRHELTEAAPGAWQNLSVKPSLRVGTNDLEIRCNTPGPCLAVAQLQLIYDP
jgi:hypothetical protein